MDLLDEANRAGLLLVAIPPRAQHLTLFDQAKLGVRSAVTLNGTTWLTIDPEVFSRAFPRT